VVDELCSQCRSHALVVHRSVVVLCLWSLAFILSQHVRRAGEQTSFMSWCEVFRGLYYCTSTVVWISFARPRAEVCVNVCPSITPCVSALRLSVCFRFCLSVSKTRTSSKDCMQDDDGRSGTKVRSGVPLPQRCTVTNQQSWVINLELETCVSCTYNLGCDFLLVCNEVYIKYKIE
jgi:hypothetical protein